MKICKKIKVEREYLSSYLLKKIEKLHTFETNQKRERYYKNKKNRKEFFEKYYKNNDLHNADKDIQFFVSCVAKKYNLNISMSGTIDPEYYERHGFPCGLWVSLYLGEKK